MLSKLCSMLLCLGVFLVLNLTGAGCSELRNNPGIKLTYFVNSYFEDIYTAGLRSISYPESSGFLVSGATPGRLWGHRILLPQDFCGKTMETVTEQLIKKIEFFRCPQSLPGVAPLTKKPEDSGYEIGLR